MLIPLVEVRDEILGVPNLYHYINFFMYLFKILFLHELLRQFNNN